jgi:hypothetical protein
MISMLPKQQPKRSSTSETLGITESCCAQLECKRKSGSTLLVVPRWARAALVIAIIYLFPVGVSSLESGIKVMGADTQERLFSSVSNPLVGLFIGLLGTALV